jgi:protein-S-isoprenylcysteine O-methyltransferase Ste14
MKLLELKVPPLLLFLIVAAGMWGLDQFVLQLSFTVPYRFVIGAVLILLGGLIGVAGLIEFARHKTTVHPLRPHKASKIVDTGIYRRSRNPMYLALLICLTGWGVILGNPLNLLLILLFALYIDRFQIEPEERAMIKQFGDDYLEYRKNVRRWM